MQYGLFSYETENIGDEIQSIAARRFLPAVDTYVDRDYVGQWEPQGDTKIIMNGWFMHPPYAWPPKASRFIRCWSPCMWIRPIHELAKRSSLLKAWRTSTDMDLSGQGICPRWSFCASTGRIIFLGVHDLTLQADPTIEKQDYILAVDLPEAVVEMLRQKTKRPVIESSPYFDANMSRENRFQVAEYFLFLYQSAHAVVTTRLHAMLPSLALGTPVFLVMDHLKYDSRRYAGLDDLVNKATDVDYLNDYNLFDVDNPRLIRISICRFVKS